MSTEIARPLLWQTQDGEVFEVTEMRTSHLFFTIRMIWNHTVPPTYQIQGCKRYALNLPIPERRRAIAAMLVELAKRDDLPTWMLAQLHHMQEACKRMALLN